MVVGQHGSRCALKIAIRVDGSFQIGSGHVMRCLTLAEALRNQQHECFFICRGHEGNLIGLIRSRGFDVFELRRKESLPVDPGGQTPHGHWLEVGWRLDAAETIDVLQGIGNLDFLIVDHYSIDANWETQVRPYTKRILVIDDLIDRDHECDDLIDSSPLRERNQYIESVLKKVRLCLGTAFTIVRPEFRKARLKHSTDNFQNSQEEERRKLFLSFGGKDPHNLGSLVLDALDTLDSDVEIDVYVFPDSPNRDLLLGAAARSRHKATINFGIDDLATPMSQADVAIGSPGIMTWEFCCVGLPGVYIVSADNQTENAQFIKSRKLGIIAGTVDNLSAESIVDAVRVLLTDKRKVAQMRQACLKAVDGLGLGRVVSVMQSSLDRKNRRIWLRPICLEDSEVIYSWQCQPGIRSFFNNPNPPTPKEHAKWFRSKLNSSALRTYIIVASTEPVGLVHLAPVERSGETLLEISIVIDSTQQNLGIGKRALANILCIHSDEAILARVKSGNSASIRLFTSAGFKQTGSEYYEYRGN